MAQVFTKTGSKSTSKVTLPKGVFGVEIKNHELLHSATRAHLAAQRKAGAKALTRGEVRGGGRKPWRQKGTGRARFGSIRVPIWRGGGITFGPTGNENYDVRISKKAKRQAIRQALTVKKDDISILEDLTVKEGKTKEVAQLFDKMKLQQRQVLLVVDTKTPEIMRATSNLGWLNVVTANYLSAYTILSAHHVVITKPALEAIENWLGDKS